MEIPRLILKADIRLAAHRTKQQLQISDPLKRACDALRILIITLSLLTLVINPKWATAQNRNAGEIRGAVVDTGGAALPGVHVDVTNGATGVQIHAITGESGLYDLPYVQPGDYSVTFTKDGFERFQQTGIAVHVETITVNAALKIGSVTTTVDVSARPPLLKTETSEQSTLLSLEQLTELPVVGSNWQTLTELLPGVTPGKGGTSTSGATISINGSQQYQASWLVDGAPATLPVSYNPDHISPPLETIAEVDMTTSGFGAEYGNGLATFNVITKGGTNRFHGSLWEYVQNDIFNADPKNWSATPVAKPPIRWNMFGGTIGGPIIRSKYFFFFGYQANIIRQYSTGLYTFPTDDMRAGNFSGLAQIYNPSTTVHDGNTYVRQPFKDNKITSIDPVAATIQKFIPEPNSIDPNNPTFNNYYFAASNPGNQYWYSYRADGDLTTQNHVYLSGLITPSRAYHPSPDCPIDCYSQSINEISTQVTDTWTISNTKLNEIRLAFARENAKFSAESVGKGYPAQIGLPDLPGDNFPIITASNGPSISIGGSSTDALLAEDAVVASDTFNWIFGKHTVKLGGEYNNWSYADGWETINAGTFRFTGVATRDPNTNNPNPSAGIGYADFLLGQVGNWSVSLPPETGSRNSNYQLYAQDYYKIRNDLTLNFGLRFIYQKGWTEQHNRFANYDPTLTNPATNKPGALGFAGVQIPDSMQAAVPFFAPRIGFAWVPKSSWSVRGGFGLYPISWSWNAYAQGVGTGFTTTGSKQSTDNLTEAFQLSSGPPAPVVSTAATRNPELLNGQNVNYLPYHTPMAYLHEWQLSIEHQLGNYLFEAAYVGNVGTKISFQTDINQVPEAQLSTGVRPNTTYQSINATLSTGRSNYNALQLTAKRQFNNGFSFLANYTWAKSMDTGTGNGGNGPALDVWQNAYSPSANYGPSSGDVRQAVNGSVLYQLPFGRGRRYASHSELADLTFGGWQLSTAFQARTGLPFTPVMSNNLSFAQSGTWWPDRIGKGTVAHPNIHQWFDTSAFVAPAPHTFGDSRRNILYGPRFADLDLSLAKRFAMPIPDDNSTIEFKVDAYDFFNHPNYGMPNSNIGSAGAGTISSSSTHRTLQLGATLRF